MHFEYSCADNQIIGLGFCLMLHFCILVDGIEFGIHGPGFTEADWFGVDLGDGQDLFGG